MTKWAGRLVLLGAILAAEFAVLEAALRWRGAT
jgi:hypothetical protein